MTVSDAPLEPASQVDALRCQLDVSVSEFARRLSVSRGYAADLCSGRRVPSLPVAARLDGLANEPRFLPEILAKKMRGNA